MQLFGVSRYVLEFGYVESEFSRVLLEGGWVGCGYENLSWIADGCQPEFRGFMRWAVWFVVAIGQPIVFNPHNAAFLLLGIILVDNIIWRQEIEKRRKLILEAEKRKKGKLVQQIHWWWMAS